MLTDTSAASGPTNLTSGFTPQQAGEVMARGPNFVYAREFILSTYGADVWAQILADMPAEARDIWEELLLVTGSYSFSAFKEMIDSLARVVGDLPDAETAEMYEFIAEESLSTIYKFFFRFADPSFVIKRYPMLWKRFFESGEVRILKAQQGGARLEFELPAIFLDWLRPACFGYSNKAVKMAGGRGLVLDQVAQEEVPGGIWRTTYDLRWEE